MKHNFSSKPSNIEKQTKIKKKQKKKKEIKSKKKTKLCHSYNFLVFIKRGEKFFAFISKDYL